MPSFCGDVTVLPMRRFAYLLGMVAPAFSLLLAQDDLPQNPEEPLDIEPPLLIQEIPARLPTTTNSAVVTMPDPDQIQIALEKARKSAAAGERLFRSGIIARIDMENRALKVVRFEADLAKARLEKAKEDFAVQQNRFDAGEITKVELDQAKAALTTASTEAAAAVARHDKAEMDEALLNVRRQKKLLASGSGRKLDVSRAEEKVLTLEQQQHEQQGQEEVESR